MGFTRFHTDEAGVDGAAGFADLSLMGQFNSLFYGYFLTDNDRGDLALDALDARPDGAAGYAGTAMADRFAERVSARPAPAGWQRSNNLSI